MQVKFAYAASGIRKRGEASIGVAARAVAAPTNQTAAIVSLGQTARSAARSASFEQDKQNNKQAAPRSQDHAQPDRSDRFVRWRTAASAILLTRTGRARSSACGNGGTISASALPAAQAALEIGATLLAGGVCAGKGVPSAIDARRHRVGQQAGSTPASRYLDADFARHGEARFRTLVPDTAHAVSGVKKCAASIEMPKTLKAMPATHLSAGMAIITFGACGGSLGGDITLHDVKDSACAVLDVTKV
jgi:hypothetical protein